MNKPFHMVLFEPEIPPNTGNIIRLCANTGAQLHLIKPLGFQLNDKQLKRAGLDYHEYATLQIHDNFHAFIKAVQPERLFAIETCGTKYYTEVQFKPGDALMFGSETKGISESVLQQLPSDHILKIPMRENIRSINLSNSVAIALYEAWRQIDFQ